MILAMSLILGSLRSTAFDKNGFVVEPGAVITVADRRIGEYPMRTAKKRQLRIHYHATWLIRMMTPKVRLSRVVIEIAAAGIKTTDPTVLATVGTDDQDLNDK